ncbi:MAG: M56 family metallopeptidase [Gammaproteobacteria bacterium]
MTEWASLAVAWLLAYLVHSSLLLAVVWGVERFGRIRSGALLTGLWRGAFFGAIVTASLQTVLTTSPLQGRLQIAAAVPAQSIPMQSVAADRPLPKPGTVVSSPNTAGQTIAGAAPTLHAAVNLAQASPAQPFVFVGLASWFGRNWLWFVVASWFTIALTLLARVGFGARDARRELVGRRRLHEGFAFDTLAELSREAGARRAPRLSSSSSHAGPVSLPNGEIVLPMWTLQQLAPNQLRALLAHELAHCRRCDPQWRLAATLIRALLFFQPLNWLARAQLSAGAELACDDWAAAHTGDRRALAECLVECASRLCSSHSSAFASAMAAPGSEFTRRVTRLTHGIRSFNGEIGMKTRITIIVALAVAAFLAPGFLISPSFAASSAPTSASTGSAVASAQAQAERAAQQATEAEARTDLQKAQKELAAQRAQLGAERHAMQKTAETMRKQAEAMGKQAEKRAQAEQDRTAEAARARREAQQDARAWKNANQASIQRQKTQAKLASEQARLEAQAEAMRKAAESMREQAAAMRGEAAAMRKQARAMRERAESMRSRSGP